MPFTWRQWCVNSGGLDITKELGKTAHRLGVMAGASFASILHNRGMRVLDRAYGYGGYSSVREVWR